MLQPMLVGALLDLRSCAEVRGTCKWDVTEGSNGSPVTVISLDRVMDVLAQDRPKYESLEQWPSETRNAETTGAADYVA